MTLVSGAVAETKVFRMGIKQGIRDSAVARLEIAQQALRLSKGCWRLLYTILRSPKRLTIS